MLSFRHKKQTSKNVADTTFKHNCPSAKRTTMSCKNRELSYVKKSKSSVDLSPTIIEHIVVEEGTSSDLFEVGRGVGWGGRFKGRGIFKAM